jgi:FOG: WD40 repeat
MTGSDSYNLSSDSSMLVISDTRSGVRKDTLEGYFAGINSIRYSPNGKYIIAIGGYYFDDSTTKKTGIDSRELSWATLTWNATSGKLLHIHKLERLKKHEYWGTQAINKVDLWFDHTNKDLLFVNDGYTVEARNVLTGKLVSSLWEHTGNSHSYVLGKNKRTVFKRDGNTLKIIDILSGKMTGSFQHTVEIEKFRVDEKNNVVITVTKENHLHIWDINTGKLLRTFDGGAEKIFSFEPSPADKHLVLFSKHPPENEGKDEDEDEGETLEEIRMWDWGLNKFLWTITLPQSKLKGEFSPDGKNLAVYADPPSDYFETEINLDHAQVLDVRTGKKKSNFTGHASYVRSGAFSPDEKRLVTAYSDSTIRIWDMDKGQFTTTLTGHSNVVNRVEFTADGSYLASASDDSTARIWDAWSGKLLYTLGGNEGPVYSARFSTDMKYIVTISEDDGRVWDAGTGKLLHVLEGAGGIEARFSPDGKYILCDAGLWNAGTGKLVFELDWHNGRVNHSQFSSDGKYIVTASADETAKLWSVDYGELLFSFDDHTDEVVYATFSQDSKKVITASLDNTVKIWDVQTGRLEKSIDLGSNTVVVDMHIPGNKLLCVAAGSETRIIKLSTGELTYSFFSLEKNGYLVVDRFNRFDGTENARKLLYFTCNDEVIELDQVKDQLWTPGLAGRIIKGDSINALKLADLNICGLTPQVKERAGNNDEYHFQVTPRRGGLGETALYLNGIEIRRYARSQLKQNGGSYDIVFKKSDLLPYLVPGEENAVQVRAWVQDNTISSRGLIKKLDKTKDSTANPDLYAVFVGISDYKGDELDLKYAAKDAEDMGVALSVAARKLLNTDGKEHVFTYHLTTTKGYYRFPEKIGIRKTLEEIGTKARANDILLLFFAGHGLMEGKNKKQFYFLTADASRNGVADAIGDMGISTAELTEWVKPAHIKAQKRIMIFDACNSGQAIRDFVQLGKPGQGYVAGRSDESGQQVKAIERLNSQSGMIILSASAATSMPMK